jgi:hypothetical protein
MPNATGLSKLPVHIDSLSQAISVITQYGDEKQQKKIKHVNKSTHYGEVVKLANKIIAQQNGTLQ